jgi:hypothetical protein
LDKKKEDKEKRSDDKEVSRTKPCLKPSGDIDDFIFEDERYKCSEK